jgi:peptide/nickel transport system ATP-binding protein
MALLDVQDLSIDYLVDASAGHGSVALRAVEGVGFRLDKGQSLGLVGESGCGKTTVMMSLLRLLPEEGRIVGGQVLFDGQDLLACSESQMRQVRWHGMSMVFQGAMNALNPVRTVESQIVEVLKYHNVERATGLARLRAGELLQMVGIPAERGRQYPHQYSGGMRQRAVIAMALACNPQVLIADEPTTALDVMIQAQILELLEQLQAEFDLALVIVTHDLGMVAEVCDDVLVMYGGMVAEYASSDVIFNSPQHPYTQRLLEAFPDVQDPGSTLASIPGNPPRLDALPPGCRFEPRCHRRQADCATIRPPLIQTGAGHWVACPYAGVARGVDAIPVTAAEPASTAGRPEAQPRLQEEESTPPEDTRRAPSILRVENLHKHFPLSRGLFGVLAGRPRRHVRAVDGVSFSLDKGEILALVGESGSGKTTVGMNVLGLQTPTRGRVLLEDYDVAEWAHGHGPSLERGGGDTPGGNGLDLTGLSRRRRVMLLRERAQMVFQDPYESLNPNKTIYDIVAEPLKIHRLTDSRQEQDERVRSALEVCGLVPAEHFWDRLPAELSGGQRQRVVIAGALVLGPELLVADEPVSMLDVSIRAEILSLLHELRAERQITILYTTHDLATAGYFTDRMAVMYLGRVVELGPTLEVLRQPRHPYTQALLSVVPVPNPRRRRKRTILEGEIPNPSEIPPGCRFHPRCPQVIPECRESDPQLAPVAAGHEVACIRWSGDQISGHGNGKEGA